MALILKSDEAYHVLCGVFGDLHPIGWPSPPRSHWISADPRIDKALKLIRADRRCDHEFRDIYWAESRKGQYVEEDAGGFMWRCWCAAIGYPFNQGTTYADAIESLASSPTATPTPEEVK